MTNGSPTRGTSIAVYIGLGSNLGDREANLHEAIKRIEALGLNIGKASSIYETEPVGFKGQPWFLNQVVEAEAVDELTSPAGPIVTDADVMATIQGEAFLSELLMIEEGMGRERRVVNGPRLIDIDLLLFGDMVIAHSKANQEWPFIDRNDLIVPHPRMHQRRFVLEPLCEIAPELVHPVLGTTLRELLAKLDDDSRVRPYPR
ncbi:MAG TPA: 2-amino-4-hydroxy-6-hydroxymethyldihydropteridine diphosphokinase [Blastocatellia bacterium]|nr:2-amino-4-hydroxy-6-hydroxymethyldihydropteridine diphosphokinase [Blastocatellia bacterium]